MYLATGVYRRASSGLVCMARSVMRVGKSVFSGVRTCLSVVSFRCQACPDMPGWHWSRWHVRKWSQSTGQQVPLQCWS